MKKSTTLPDQSLSGARLKITPKIGALYVPYFSIKIGGLTHESKIRKNKIHEYL